MLPPKPPEARTIQMGDEAIIQTNKISKRCRRRKESPKPNALLLKYGKWKCCIYFQKLFECSNDM